MGCKIKILILLYFLTDMGINFEPIFLSAINSDAKNLSHLSHISSQWKYSRYPREYDQNRFGISYNPYTPLFGIFHRTALSHVWFKRWGRNMRELYPNMLSSLKECSANRFFITPCERDSYDNSKR